MQQYYYSFPDECPFRLLIMTDSEFKPLIVEGEEVGEYNDTTFSFGKWCMATVELWSSPKAVSYTHLTLPTSDLV